VKRIECFFENVLWNSRLLTGVAVFASLIVAIIMFYVATVDVFFLLGQVVHYTSFAAHEREELHGVIVGRVAEIVDGYLFATIMIIFGLGLYELFISKIDTAENSAIAPRLLLIRSIDDLKERLAKVVFLILIVRYFEYALQYTITGALDLLYLAVGIALIALSLYLTGRTAGGHGSS
jgi:uncharacterized membrane protein YqhA